MFAFRTFEVGEQSDSTLEEELTAPAKGRIRRRRRTPGNNRGDSAMSSTPVPTPSPTCQLSSASLSPGRLSDDLTDHLTSDHLATGVTRELPSPYPISAEASGHSNHRTICSKAILKPSSTQSTAVSPTRLRTPAYKPKVCVPPANPVNSSPPPEEISWLSKPAVKSKQCQDHETAPTLALSPQPLSQQHRHSSSLHDSRAGSAKKIASMRGLARRVNYISGGFTSAEKIWEEKKRGQSVESLPEVERGGGDGRVFSELERIKADISESREKVKIDTPKLKPQASTRKVASKRNPTPQIMEKRAIPPKAKKGQKKKPGKKVSEDRDVEMNAVNSGNVQ